MASLLRRTLQKDPRLRLRDIGEAGLVLSGAPDLTAAPAAPSVPVPAAAWRLPAVWAALALVAVSSAVVGAWTWTRMRPSEKPPVTRLSILLPAGQVLGGAGGPAVSRDGRSIAYVATEAGGVSRLYVRALDRSEASVVADSEGARQPFFSPDGRRIGFFARGKLLTVSLSGGAATAIADATSQSFGAAWGEDDTIVYVPSLSSGILRIPSSGGQPRRLTEPDGAAGGYAHVWPQFLPGGRSVLFTTWSGFNFEASGCARVSLEPGASLTRLAPGTWTFRYARSGHLLMSGSRGVRAVAIDLDHPQPTRPQTFVVDDVFSPLAFVNSWLSVSDSGTLVYVPGDPNLGTLTWVDRDGRATPIADKAASVADIALSPDGTRVVVEEQDDAQNDALWVVDMRRGTRSRLTHENEGFNDYPVWSRDGARIFFASNRGGDWDLYSVPSVGGPAKHLLARKANQFPVSAAPDGTLLFDERTGGGADLWTLSPDGTPSPWLVSPATASKVGGQFSPDGRTIAYISDETGRDEVYVRSFSRPDDAAAVSTDGGRGPRWSPDGKELFYRNGDAFLAASVSSNGPLRVEAVRKLFDIRAAWGRSTMQPGYAVSPDGRQLLVLLLDPRAVPTQINVVLNWFDELKAKVPTLR